ncbi:MAG: DnaJ domain-containing protein [Desulfobacterales bacterium]|jgi:DnaJ like chaperone protein
MKWFLAVLALLYALNPIDLFPDLIAGWGWLDDLFLLGVIWYLFFKRSRVPAASSASGNKGASEDTREHHDDASAGSEGEHGGLSKDPYAILGLEPGASQEDIQSAYRRLAARYHPDKLAHLGDEFQLLAEQKFKTIQAAYETLRDRR